MSNIPAGWYDDGQGGQRWWDGTQWTEHTQPAGSSPSTPDPTGQSGQPGPSDASGTPDRPAAPQNPGADMPTQIAPNRAADFGGAAQQSPYGAQPAQPSYGGGAEPAQPGSSPYGAPGPQYGAPGQQPYGAPGQQPYGAPGAPQYGPPPSGGGSNKKLLLLIGGGVGVLVLGVVLLVVLLSVLGGGSPKDVAEDYLDASTDGDFEEVCELSSASNKKTILDQSGADDCGGVEAAFNEDAPDGQSIDDFFDDLEFDYKVGDVKEDGDEATVAYTYSVKYTGDEEGAAEFINEEDADGELQLVKEDGDWKVDSDSGGVIN